MAVISTVYSVVSVEAATLGFSQKLLVSLLPAYRSVHTGFETGTRLTGILGNANILSSIVAFGILFSICLWCAEENGKRRLIWAGVAAVNAFTFLLLFSMGGTACFVVAVVLYLIFAGKGRGGALVRKLLCALPTLVLVFVAFPFFNSEKSVIPLAALLGDILTVVVLEKVLGDRFGRLLEGRDKVVFGVLIGVVVLAIIYVVAGLNLTGAYTFGGEALERSAYPEAGEHTLSVQASGDVNVTIISQDMSQVMMHTNTVLYKGSADGAVFTVPENSEVCYFTFTAADGVVLEQAELNSGESIKLNYTILPGFVANRLQGLRANQNAVQRTVFFRDGLKMFAKSPVVGNGVGSFETGVTGVQDFYYETKYIHNHYIQVLLECGVLGFAPFVGALGTMVWVLFKRRKEEEWEFAAAYPALWAALGMAAGHMAVEVSMSNVIFVCMVFATFGLIIRCCVEKSDESTMTSVERGKLRKKMKTVRMVSAVLPAVFLLSVCSNIVAGKIARGKSEDYGKFLSNLETSVMLDPYEANDAKLSYVMNVYNMQMTDHFSKANKYADQLLEEQSNSIPAIILDYYLGTGQYEKAIKAANASAEYSASDEETWTKVIHSLRAYLLDATFPGFMVGDGRLLVDGMLGYYGRLMERNAVSMETIELDLDSKDFFGKVLMLDSKDAAIDAVVDAKTRFVFDSRLSCDADADGTPDQVSSAEGAVFEQGAVKFVPGGWFKVEVRELAADTVARVELACQNPDAVTVEVVGGSAAEKTGAGTWNFTMTQGEGAALYLRVSSAVEQTAEYITVNAVK